MSVTAALIGYSSLRAQAPLRMAISEDLLHYATSSWVVEPSGSCILQLLVADALHPTWGTKYALGDFSKDTDNKLSYMQQAFAANPTHADTALKLATMYMFTGKAPEAIAVLDEFLRHNPEHIEVNMMLARILQQSGDTPKARDLYLKAAKNSPTNSAAHYHAVSQLFVTTTIVGEPLAPLFNDPIIYDASDVELNYTLLRSLLGLNLTDAALQIKNYANTAVTEHPAFKQLILSFQALQSESLTAARPFLLQMAGTPGVSQETLDNIVVELIAKEMDGETQKVPQHVLEILEELVQLQKENYPLWQTYLQVLEYNEAHSQYDSALAKAQELFPTTGEFFALEIGRLLSQEKYAEALQTARKQQARFPQDLAFYQLGGYAAQLNRQYEEAEQLYSTALSAKSTLSDDSRAILLSDWGDLYISQNKYEEAFEKYEASLALNGLSAATLNNYAYYLAKENSTRPKSPELEKAVRMAAKALELSPNSPTMLDTYGYVLTLNGNSLLGVIYLRRAIDKSANQPKAVYYDHLASALIAEGKYPEALQALEKAQALEPTKERAAHVDLLKRKNAAP